MTVTLRLSDQRLRRLSLWLALTVAWFAAHVLAHVAPREARRMLNEHAWGVRVLLLACAVRRVGLRQRVRTSIPMRLRRITCRNVVGPALRRALRRGALAARARLIGAILATPERWIAHIARRLKRGFTKRGVLPKPQRTRPGARRNAAAPARVINSS